MRASILLFAFAAPLAAELLETEITFEGTGCVSCAESLEPRLARIRGVESVKLDLERSRVELTLEPGNKARIGPLRLRVTQDGTKILAMTAIVQGAVVEKDGSWTLAVSGANETIALRPAAGMRLEAGRAYRLAGPIAEDRDGELSLAAESAEPIPQP
jgi:copper chaperone CopZ